MNTKATGKMNIFAAGKVTKTAGLPGNKFPYDAVYRFTAEDLIFLGWYPGAASCSSPAQCQKGVKLK